MRACASFWAEALPAAIRVFNCSRSSAVSVTRYFFMADSSRSPQQSRPEGSPQLKSATPLGRDGAECIPDELIDLADAPRHLELPVAETAFRVHRCAPPPRRCLLHVREW